MTVHYLHKMHCLGMMCSDYSIATGLHTFSLTDQTLSNLPVAKPLVAGSVGMDPELAAMLAKGREERKQLLDRKAPSPVTIAWGTQC